MSCADAQVFERKLLGEDMTNVGKAMERAGRALGEHVLLDINEWRPLPRAPKVLILCGTGHNAGDALIAADEIRKARPRSEIRVVFAMGEKDLKPLVKAAFEDIRDQDPSRFEYASLKSSMSCEQIAELLSGWYDAWDLCIDGLLGMSFRPPLREPIINLLKVINAHEAIGVRAAVDVPSGIGDQSSELCFCADFTYATGIAKAPIFDYELINDVGRIRFLDIGFFDNQFPETQWNVLSPSILGPFKDLRKSHTNKRTYGHLFFLAGSELFPGAMLMGVLGALNAGVGLVTSSVPESLGGEMAAKVPECMWLPMKTNEEKTYTLDNKEALLEKLKLCHAMVAGSGLWTSAETQDLLIESIFDSQLPVVLDANAITQRTLKSLSKRKEKLPVIFTPHEWECRRLIGKDEVPNPSDVHRFAKEHGILIVLKGPRTWICGGEQIVVSPFGGPVLARGGSGDHLAGIIGALLAQDPENPFMAACRGVVWHGLAAEALARVKGQTAVRTTDLEKYLSVVLRETV